MSNTQIASPYMTAAEAAEYLRFPSVHWFRVAVRKYGIPYLRRGRRMFFTAKQLDEFMDVADNATNPTPGGSRKRGKAA
jgi:hypothetical protein